MLKCKRVKKGFWQEHDAELRRYAEVDGLTGKQIAKLMGLSQGAVKGRAWRIGVKWHRLPLFWDIRQKRKLEKLATAKRTLEPERDYWISRYGWSFPPHGHCVFPKGDLRNRSLSFCGEPVNQVDRSYCPVHHRMAYSQSIRGVLVK